MIRSFISDKVDVFFNLALEKFLFNTATEDTFFLWRSQPAIVCGKHQNIYAEINHSFLKNNSIDMARRISGGGTVYHDLGNINYAFILNEQKPVKIDFEKYLSPFMWALKETGIETEIRNQSDLFFRGKKISGNAAHIKKSKILHHGTLLFDANLQNLTEVLHQNEQKYFDKAVKSRPASVANISGFYHENISVEDYMTRLFESTVKVLGNCYYLPLSLEEKDKILQHQIVDFHSWEWTVGYGPRYEFRNKIFFNNSLIDCFLFVENGIIKNFDFKSLPELGIDLETLKKLLPGTPHVEHYLMEVLLGNFSSWNSADMHEFVSQMF